VQAGCKGVPRIIWFLWFQGLEKAPYVVRKCHESWAARNPGWELVCLDDASLQAFASADYHVGSFATLSRQQRSDLLRLDLLAKHGGVWADATCFCVQPLDSWLPPNLDSGFFAFSRPHPKRIISSWFLAAEPQNILVSRLFEFMLDYWGSHPFRRERQHLSGRVLARFLRVSPRTRVWWFSQVIRDWLAISPYYAIHFAFEKLVREDPECARIWECTPKVSAVPPHRLQSAGLLWPLSVAIRSEIDRREIPIYKTAWKLKQAIPEGSVLEYLLGRSPRAYQDLPDQDVPWH
jgi:Capsular polysaccharide synthesis protein